MYEEIIKTLESSGNYKVIERLPEIYSYNNYDGEEIKTGIFIDTETTGLNSSADVIIEIAMIPFEYSDSGNIYKVHSALNQLHDPGFPIPEIITQITGITDKDVKGKKIDIEKIQSLLETANLVVAHNASFDRPFCENLYEGFKSIPWACSMRDIDWESEDIGIRKLEYLAYTYDFFYEAHRATTDCRAGIHILSKKLPVSGISVLKAMLDNTNLARARVWAIGSPFNKKDFLKDRGYRWSPGNNGDPKSWYIDIDEKSCESELQFLEKSIYMRKPTEAIIENINALNRYSSRSQ